MERIATFTLRDFRSNVSVPIHIEEGKLTPCPYCSGSGLVQHYYSEGIWQSLPPEYAMPCFNCEGNGGIIPGNSLLIKEPFSRKQVDFVKFVYPPPVFFHRGAVATMFFQPRSVLSYPDWLSDVPFPKTDGMGTILTSKEWNNNFGIRGYVVSVPQGEARKTIIVRTEHLEPYTGT
jgi:hypothetical protein